MEEERKTKKTFKPLWVIYTVAVIVLAVVFPVFAWFSMSDVASYAPVSSYESLFIGAGHISISGTSFADGVALEDVRYLYLEGIDLTDADKDYYDYVFCVYGSGVSAFNIQLGYTTNNQFTYKIYNATESSVNSEGAIPYTTHGDTPTTYYYKPSGGEISVNYVNKTTAGDGMVIADSSKHIDTYGSYNNVNRFAEPIYMQTRSAISSDAVGNGAFAKYFILRIYKNDKDVNDRETDVICIAVKSGIVIAP